MTKIPDFDASDPRALTTVLDERSTRGSGLPGSATRTAAASEGSEVWAAAPSMACAGDPKPMAGRTMAAPGA